MIQEAEHHSLLPTSAMACPGLSEILSWDEPAHLRGELYTREHLVAHAVELALSHGKPSTALTPGPLRRRFTKARERIYEAYDVLTRDAKNRREPSPAEEWLLDNANVVEDQLREIAEDLPFGYLIELPRLTLGSMQGHPRVYGLCLDYLRHTDVRVDLDTLSTFVLSYQTVERLTIGELWAVPIMLRLGLILTVGALAASEAYAEDRERADTWASRLLSAGQTRAGLGACLVELERSQKQVSAAFLVQLLRRLREHDAPLEPAREWVAKRCAAMGTTPDELTRREHLRLAADQVSVGNAITSMRAVSAMDWDEFFERTSEVEKVLRRDPSGAYPESDKRTRDRCRHAVEDLARRGRLDEVSVAERALELSRAPSAKGSRPVLRHVGYYLLDAGRAELERGVGYRPSLRALVVRAIRLHPETFYFGALALFTGLLVWAAARAWSDTGLPIWPLPVVLLLFALPASEVSLALVSSFVVTVLPPRLLSKLDFSSGIPRGHRTLVVVPALIDSAASVDQLIEDLLVRSLGNPDENLYFALLTDFTDAPAERVEGDDELLGRLEDKLAQLNGRGKHETERHWLLHRRRVYNPIERCYMGWERKRGKLEELNRLLRGDEGTTFSRILAPRALFPSIRYVITLDADTDLPRDTGRKLVATLAHPLNVPELDVSTARVVRGHAIIQPRVGTLPASSRKTRFAAILSGPSGIDPYTTAVSDIYQDLFDQGSYVGKGIYDVDAFQSALAGRVPENRLLSHDLFEGIYARSALATDIEVLDEQPASYDVQVGRQHRWVRGDWQLLPWLAPRMPAADGSRANDLSLIDAWKIVDNLRRSLLGPAIVALLVVSWFIHERVASAAAMVVAAVFIVPLCARLILSLVRESTSAARPSAGSLGGDLKTNAPQVLLNLVFTLDQAWVSLDAIVRSLHRLFVSKEHLLEWTAMRQSSQAGTRSRARPRMWLGSAACVGVFLLLLLTGSDSWILALPVLLAWAAAPAVDRWLSRPPARPRRIQDLAEADRRSLRLVARKTWRFFEVFVTAEDNFLPPDNYQEDPRGETAHRTSPTNMGLYLLSVLSARDFGYISLRQCSERLEQTLTTLEGLEKREGHILNWYDTTTLRPLEPQYVSTVDSGNLAAYLWTLREGCAELSRLPLVSTSLVQAVQDSVRLALDGLGRAAVASADAPSSGKQDADPPLPEALKVEAGKELAALDAHLTSLGGSALPPHELIAALATLRDRLTLCRASIWGRWLGKDASQWLESAEATLAVALAEVDALAPGLRASAQLSRLSAVTELSAPAAGLAECLQRADSPSAVVLMRSRAVELAEEVEHVLSAASLSPEERGLCQRDLDTLLRNVELGADACQELLLGLEQIGARAGALADAMNFRFLLDADRELFAIGYNVSSARLDPSHYDLLASEARLASLFCIAKGDAPQSHWFRLGRPRATTPGGRALLSWSGSMFEYLMPLLCTRNNENTLLDEAYHAAIERQRGYAAEHGVPWGISEGAYNVMDLRMTYQYRAFGVPGLGLKAGLGEDLVITPYATILAGMVRPDLICKNLRALEKEGLDGPYGFYESIDYSPEHVPPGRRGVVVKAFMAHHQGMILVALDNILQGGPMQRRFHNDPRIKATELLLEERVPLVAPKPATPATVMPTAARVEPRADVVEHVGLRGAGPMRVHLLGHGELSSVVTATGAGVTTWKGLDVNRFREDPLLEAGGIYLYIKNRTQDRVWSAAYQPTRAEPNFYNVTFSIDRVEFHRKDGDIQTVTEVALSPEHAVEVRRVTLTNQGESPVELEVTSYSEVVLAPRGADVAHRAFGNMFVETEALPERSALLAKRRPRLLGEAEVWMVQMLMGEGDGFGPLDFDCSRSHFLGRGNSPVDPEALRSDAPLAKQTGNVLDPALALRRSVRLAPGATARLTLTTGLGSTREEVLGLIETYSAQHSIARALELGWAGVRVELRHLGITPTEVHRFQRLLSAVIFPHPALRAGAPPASNTTRGTAALWAQGISGDLPIVLCRIDHADFAELCRDLILAHEFWRLNGFISDLVIINDEPSGYLQPAHDTLRDLIRQAEIDQRGGVFLRRSDQMSEEERELCLCAARVVLRASQGSLARQLRRAATARPLPPSLALPAGPPLPGLEAPPPPRPELTFDNGLGGFGADGREYVIALAPGSVTPLPWCNVMANAHFGSLVSEVGSSFSWFENSQRHRLTPWNNDAVSDPSGELFYIRDEQDGSFWSATPKPLGGDAHFLVKHGQGYSQFEHTRRALRHELTLFVHATEAVKFSRLRLQNLAPRARRLSLFALVEWVLGSSRESSRTSISSSTDEAKSTLFASNPLGVFPAHRAFFTTTGAVLSLTSDREEFFGAAGCREAPEALARTQLSGSVGSGLDPCAGLHVAIELAPGQSIELAFVLGQAESLDQAHHQSRKYRSMDVVNDALERAQGVWKELTGAVQIKTPDRALDVLQNHWLLYQSVSSRLWGRTGFYQSSGAYGFRDQLQDVLAAIHSRPAIAREHLLRSAAHQFVEGDVQHWWHEETGGGLRTRCSDDMLWLPYVTAEYVRITGDRAILDESLPFLTERSLGPGEEDLFSSPGVSEIKASLYEHCVRALDVGATSGPHGLPTMRGGDWNDGMNRVGHEGKGESVWLAWFLAKTLGEFAPIALVRGDREREKWCKEQLSRLARAVDEHAWDGQWYRRGYFDDGTPLGSRDNSECSIDAIAQSWSVIAGIGDPERAATAVAASEARLVDAEDKLMKLLAPPFEHTRPDPGYIQSYPRGIRENGGQYTHGVLWTVLALTLLGAGDRAGALLALLNPIRHGDTPEGIQRYRVEPYVVAADVYSDSGHKGRGGWTWYTGSAGWMYRIVLEHVLGVRRRGNTLAMAPCIPSHWPSFEVNYRYGQAEYRISVDNPDQVSQGVVRLEIDGKVSSEGYVRLVDDGLAHDVRVTLGRVLPARLARASVAGGRGS